MKPQIVLLIPIGGNENVDRSRSKTVTNASGGGNQGRERKKSSKQNWNFQTFITVDNAPTKG